MRQWGKKEGEDEGGVASGDGAKGEEDKKDKLPKRKVAALIVYNGINYKGSQVCVFPSLLLRVRPIALDAYHY